MMDEQEPCIYNFLKPAKFGPKTLVSSSLHALPTLVSYVFLLVGWFCEHPYLVTRGLGCLMLLLGLSMSNPSRTFLLMHVDLKL